MAILTPQGTLRADTAEAALLIEIDTPGHIAQLLEDTTILINDMKQPKPIPVSWEWQYERTEFIGSAIVNSELARYEIDINDQIRQLQVLDRILSQNEYAKRNIILDAANVLLGLFNTFQTHKTNDNLKRLQQNQVHITKSVQHQTKILEAHSRILKELQENEDINYRLLVQTAKYFKNMATIATHTRSYIHILHTLLTHRCHPEILADKTGTTIQALQTKINQIGLHFAADPELQLVQNHADFTAYNDKIIIHVPIYVIQQGVQPLNLFAFEPTAHYHNGTQYSIQERASYLAISPNKKYYTEFTKATWDKCIAMGPTMTLCTLPLRPTFNASTCLINIFINNNTEYCRYEATPMDRTTGYTSREATHIEFDQDTMITIKSNFSTEAFQIKKGTTAFKNDRPKEISWNKGRIYIAPSLKQTLKLLSVDMPLNYSKPNFTHKAYKVDNYVNDELKKVDFKQKEHSIFFIMAITAFSTLLIAAIVCVTCYLKLTADTKKIHTGLNQSKLTFKSDATSINDKLSQMQEQIAKLALTVETLKEKVQEIHLQIN